MRVLSDYRCSKCNTEFEAFARIEDEVRCKCGHVGKRLISPVKCSLDGTSGDFPGAAMKWKRDHERAARKGSY